MVQQAGYSDIALSFSPEAYYTGIPGADVSRGMLYGQGKAEKLHADTRLQMELTQKEDLFNKDLSEKIRQYDKSMAFGNEQFDFFKDQYADQYGLQKDYLSLSQKQANRSSSDSGFDMNAFLDRMNTGGPSLTPFDLGDRSGVTRFGASPAAQQNNFHADSPSSYYNPNSDNSIGDFLGGEDYDRSIEDSYQQFGDWY
jgi:hypothetical protein